MIRPRKKGDREDLILRRLGIISMKD